MRRYAAIVGLTVLALVLGATVVVASGADHARTARAGSPSMRDTAVTTDPGCGMGFDTQTESLTPPDDIVADNPPAGSVILVKPCTGPVIGQFNGETNTVAAGEFIHLEMRATCVASGGFTKHCTVGDQVFASPGHTYLQNNDGVDNETHGINMAFKGLKRGKWLFEALPGGNGTASLVYRSFVVEAFRRGT